VLFCESTGGSPIRILMPKKMIQPGHELMLRVNQAFLDHGYSGLSMVGLARACGFTQRALYYYFSNKEEAFRAAIQSRNDDAMRLGLEAGQAVRVNGGSALDIFTEIINIRYGETRRALNLSPHTIELNAEAFKRCRAVMIQVAVSFQADLEKLIVDFGETGLLHLKDDVTPAQLAQALADGASGVNQALPPISSEDLAGRYRQMCKLILYGSARA
jgi:AcrR family transcriptional regulator